MIWGETAPKASSSKSHANKNIQEDFHHLEAWAGDLAAFFEVGHSRHLYRLIDLIVTHCDTFTTYWYYGNIGK